jgi:hypothetical protein
MTHITADINNRDDGWVQVTLSGDDVQDLTERHIEWALNAELTNGADAVTQLGGAPEDLRNFICAVFELYGMDGLVRVTDYVMKHRGTNAFTGNPL